MFDVNNIRYVSATKIGEWERDKLCRVCLLTGDDSPYVWDFGSAAMHHKKFSDWLEPDHCRAGVVGMPLLPGVEPTLVGTPARAG